MKLNRTNVEEALSNYLNSINSIKLPARYMDVLTFMYDLKRKPLNSGPYPQTSLFETSNRVFSDLVILFGVRQLLTKSLLGDVQLPFDEYEVSFGVEHGNDLVAIAGTKRLVGEAFNVAPSFFQGKKATVIKKLRSEENVDYRIIIFNADAVQNPDYYINKSRPSMIYLPVDIDPSSNRNANRDSR